MVPKIMMINAIEIAGNHNFLFTINPHNILMNNNVKFQSIEQLVLISVHLNKIVQTNIKKIQFKSNLLSRKQTIFTKNYAQPVNQKLDNSIGLKKSVRRR